MAKKFCCEKDRVGKDNGNKVMLCFVAEGESRRFCEQNALEFQFCTLILKIVETTG